MAMAVTAEAAADKDVASRLDAAVAARAKYIREEAESLTMGNFRRLLEQDMGLECMQLDAHKSRIKQLVDEVLISEEIPKSRLMPDQGAIKDAIVKRLNYLKEEQDKVTMQQIRRVLEEDLGLEKLFLDSEKQLIKKLVDEVLSTCFVNDNGGGNTEKEENNAAESSEDNATDREPSGSESSLSPAKRPKKKRKARTEDDGSDSGSLHEAKENSGSESASPRVPQKKTNSRKIHVEDDNESEREPSPQTKQTKKKTSEANVAKPIQSKAADQLKQMIKQAGMNIPPSVYKRAKQAPEDEREDVLVKELESILKREGLNRNSSDKEIRAVKKKKERQKDLEGIDVGNILTEGRGRRQTSSTRLKE